MSIQASGPIKLQDIEDEFGGSVPTSLTEYYRNGSYVTSNNSSVPTSGLIKLTDFYGAVRQFSFSITSNTQNANIRTLAVAAGWDGSAPLITTVNSGVWLWSDSTSLGGAIISGSFPGGLTLLNYGKIIGRGGDGGLTQGAAGSAGGPALTVASTGVSVTNNSGAYIAGGGGGGGGARRFSGQWSGGGGGAGGGTGGGGAEEPSTVAGGSIGNRGGNAVGWGANTPSGGQAGGEGAADGESSSGTDYGRSASGGGRILPGVTQSLNSGTTYSYGGGAGQQGGPGFVSGNSNGGGGGGGWGAAGGNATYSGGAAGAAISGTAISLTNSGTVYGST
jgi:hypothetical protein